MRPVRVTRKSEGRVATTIMTTATITATPIRIICHIQFLSFLVDCRFIITTNEARCSGQLYCDCLKLVFWGTHTIIFGKSWEANGVLRGPLAGDKMETGRMPVLRTIKDAGFRRAGGRSDRCGRRNT